jgi:hypothetical protein
MKGSDGSSSWLHIIFENTMKRMMWKAHSASLKNILQKKYIADRCWQFVDKIQALKEGTLSSQ